MISDFKVNAANTHVGLITFSSSARVVSNFAKTYNPDELRSQLSSVRQDASKSSNIAAVLKTAESEMFTLKGRSRRGIPKVLILVTKGPLETKDSDSVIKNSEALKGALGGVEVINVYIGPKGSSDAALLKTISSKSQSSEDQKFFQFDKPADFAKNENLLKISSYACSGITIFFFHNNYLKFSVSHFVVGIARENLPPTVSDVSLSRNHMLKFI